MRRAAYTLCAGLCAAGVAGTAHAAPTTFTFDITSSVAPYPNGGAAAAPPLTLSFTVDGAVSFNATSDFADNGGIPPSTSVAYPFPAALTAFDLSTQGVSVTLANFVSPTSIESSFPLFPKWTLDLTADPTNGTASLALSFLNITDNWGFNGPPAGSSNPAYLSTRGPAGTIDFGADWQATADPAQYTGVLTAAPSPVPEPSSLTLLLAAAALFGAARPGRQPQLLTK
ncbi:MAG TPA: PEP-CTERM sorting domain-containing protein [Stellaceae bacterium]|jgi:hypothetical protein